MPSLNVKILSCFSKLVEEKPHSLTENLDQAISSLQQLIPDVDKTIRNKMIVDFGSGEGWHALAFGQLGALKVIGVEIDPSKVERSLFMARHLKLDQRVFFKTSIPDSFLGGCDLILSRDSMEHYQDPEDVLLTMKRCLSPEGRILISFGPPWYSLYGAHMQFFTPIPWVHLMFDEETIMTVRARYRNDGAKRYEEVPGGLNRMSVARFERLIQGSGLKIIRLEKRCVRGKYWLGKMGFFREMFINLVICELEHRS